jgi:hypothetical protein
MKTTTVQIKKVFLTMGNPRQPEGCFSHLGNLHKCWIGGL